MERLDILLGGPYAMWAPRHRSRFSPAIEPRFSFRAPDVIDVLERIRDTIQNARAAMLDHDHIDQYEPIEPANG